jgi:hypothetical protein
MRTIDVNDHGSGCDVGAAFGGIGHGTILCRYHIKTLDEKVRVFKFQ